MQKLYAKKQLSEQLLDALPDPVVWFAPVFAGRGSRVTDFEIQYRNGGASRTFGMDTAPETAGLPLFCSSLDQELGCPLFDLCEKVWETGSPAEATCHLPASGRYFQVQCSRVEEGVLCVLRDRTVEVKATREKDRHARLLNNILDSSLCAICTMEAVRNAEGEVTDFRFIQVNKQFKELGPVAAQEVTGKSMLELFPDLKDSGIFQKHCAVIETGIPARFETPYGEGPAYWFSVSSARVGDNSVVVTFADITGQKKSALEIAEQKALLDNILLHSANGISVTRVLRDAAGSVVDCISILANEAAMRYAGLPRDLYLGKTAVELVPDIIQSDYFRLCLKTLETGEPQFTQYYLELTKRWLEISVSRLDADHFITIFTDVTPAREAQQRQEQLVEELQRSNASLEEFAYAASHDLKEPIRKMNIFIDRLKGCLEGRLADEEVRLLLGLERSGKRMGLLVDDLLEYCHVGRGSEKIEAVDLNKKVRVVLEDLDLVVQEKGARIELGEMPVVHARRRQMQQLFQNLIGNALKYSRPDVPPQISIKSRPATAADLPDKLSSAARNKPYHFIEVQDNGIGFEQENAERIFNVFTRLHGNTEYAGSGVGLSIVRKVVESHNGFIWAESEPGRGATFRVLLPVG